MPETQYRYFDYHGQPARAPIDYAHGATEILGPRTGKWLAEHRTEVTEIPLATAKKLARTWCDGKLPEDLR